MSEVARMKNSWGMRVCRTTAVVVLVLSAPACTPVPAPEPLPTDSQAVTDERPEVGPAPDPMETADVPHQQNSPEPDPGPMKTHEVPVPDSGAELTGPVEAWQFLGASLETDEELAAYLMDNNCYSGEGFNRVCPDAGTEFQFNTAHQVNSVFLYPAYQGGTPEEISFDESPDDLIARLGEPDQTDGSTSFSWWYDHGAVLTVNYPGALEEEMAGGPLPDRMNQIQVHLA